MKSGLRRGVETLVLFAAACASAPPAKDQADPGKPTVQLPREARIGFPVARFSPVMGVETRPYEGGQTAKVPAAGAAGAGGAVFGALHCLGLGPALVLPPVAVACVSLMAAGGAVVGAAQAERAAERAVKAAPKAATEVDIQMAEAKMQAVAAGLEFQQRLAEQMFRGSLGRGAMRAEMLPDAGPRSPSESPRYALGQDYVMEVALLELRASAPGVQDLRYRFILKARGRLVRVADGTVMDESIHEHTTGPATVEGWTEDGGRIVKMQFGLASMRITRTFLDRWIPAQPR